MVLALTRILSLDPPYVQVLFDVLLEHVVLCPFISQWPLVFKQLTGREVISGRGRPRLAVSLRINTVALYAHRARAFSTLLRIREEREYGFCNKTMHRNFILYYLANGVKFVLHYHFNAFGLQLTIDHYPITDTGKFLAGR